MGLVWITGVSGTGKSTVRVELATRGYQSFDTDEDGIAVWRLRTTGEEVYDPVTGITPKLGLRQFQSASRQQPEHAVATAQLQQRTG